MAQAINFYPQFAGHEMDRAVDDMNNLTDIAQILADLKLYSDRMKPISCVNCPGTVTRGPDEKREHMLAQHFCFICNKYFADPEVNKKHENKHKKDLGAHFLRCYLCSEKHANKDDLIAHLQVTHNWLLYKCPRGCNFKTSSATAWELHTVQHLRGKNIYDIHYRLIC